MVEYVGQIKSFNPSKGWGFIESPQTHQIYGKDIFLLKSSLPQGAAPSQGEQVTFRVVQGQRGPQADGVQLTNAYGAMGQSPMGGMGQAMGGMGQAMGMAQSPMGMAGMGQAGAYGGQANGGRMQFGMAHTPQMPQMMGGEQYEGMVKSWNQQKGWGFLTSDTLLQTFGKDVFFMKSAVIGGFEVSQGQWCTFNVTQGDKGPQAADVQLSPDQGMPMQQQSFQQQSFQRQPVSPYGGGCGGPPVAAPGPAFMGGQGGGMMGMGRPMQQMQQQQNPMQHMQMQMQMSDPNQLWFGAVKGYNEEKGWGHIICEAAKVAFGKEIFLLRSALGGASVEAGTLVGFKIQMTPRGPQAADVAVLPAGAFEWNGQPGTRFTGVFKTFNAEKNWGFLTSDEITQIFMGKDIFVRRVTLQDPSATPNQGDTAEFSVEIGENGKLQAKEVAVFGGYVAAKPTPTSVRAAPY